MSELKQRIDAALKRITEGRRVMSIPANPRSDADIVLADCEKEIDRLNAALQARGNDALEEAARVCDANADVEFRYSTMLAVSALRNTAARIRALKSQEPGK